ncbi:hypothetical protein [Saccharopolyspora rosea]|uniref:Aminoglycoside phosphotransferase domain-containing protein n=1 Tax=Saccharopolyspora rosea TaxID=524884 RepID=A0ABW3G2I1_9PSEU|nr:hypothetical protein [Saccharopolyspora rosea]
MTRWKWGDLPTAVRVAIESHCGHVVSASSPSAGRNSDLSVTLHLGDGGACFVKGVLADSEQARLHRHERLVGPYLPAEAPRLIWYVDVDGWVINGYDYAEGHHADLSPGSPDLPRVRDAVTALGEELTPCPVNVPTLADQWGRLAAWRRIRRDGGVQGADSWIRENLDRFVAWEQDGLEALGRGDTLAHTDLHELNILVGSRVQVIDWAWSRRAPAWVDPAVLVVRLLAEGHSPDEAEAWAQGIPALRGASNGTVTAFAVTLLGVWEYVVRHSSGSHRRPLVDAARTWVHHRLAGLS